MKAIPLIACLALIAAQGRAQDGASTVQTPATPSLGARAKLYAEIKAFRAANPPPPASIKTRVDEIETDAGAAQTADDLGKAEAKLTALRDELQPKGNAGGAAGHAPSAPPPSFEQFEAYAAGSLNGFKNDGARHFDQTGPSMGGGNEAAGEPATAAGDPNSRPSAYDYVNAAPSTTLSPRPVAVPAPTALSDAWIAQTWAPWIKAHGHDISDPADLTPDVRISIPALAESGLSGAPPAAPASAAPPTPPAADPMSWATLSNSIDFSGISKSTLNDMRRISFVDYRKSTVHLLSEIGERCLLGVKWMLALVLGEKPDDLGIPPIASAYMMLGKLKDNPELQKRLHLLPLDLTTFPYETTELPARTLLIWNHDCAGFKEDGHIEFTLPISMIDSIAPAAFYSPDDHRPRIRPEQKNMLPTHPVLACSDGCEVDAMISESTPSRKPNAKPIFHPRDANHYRNLIYYAGSNGGRCLSAYVPVREGPAPMDEALTTGQTGDEHGM